MISRGKDIGRVLKDWAFDASKVNVRRIHGEDGREKIQLRLDLGILQMEVDGRPDGKKPYGRESLLEYHLSILENFKKKKNDDSTFELNREDCSNLQQEAIQYYHRYLSLFHLGDFEGVMRDTTRNLKVFDFIKKYAVNSKDRHSFEQFRPYVIMMNTRAKASLLLKKKNYEEAIKAVKKGIKKLKGLYSEIDSDLRMESSPEISFLRRWLNEIKGMKPVDPIEKLKKEMDEAVKNENYELAAKLRDQIKAIEMPFSIEDNLEF